MLRKLRTFRQCGEAKVSGNIVFYRCSNRKPSQSRWFYIKSNFRMSSWSIFLHTTPSTCHRPRHGSPRFPSRPLKAVGSCGISVSLWSHCSKGPKAAERGGKLGRFCVSHCSPHTAAAVMASTVELATRDSERILCSGFGYSHARLFLLFLTPTCWFVYVCHLHTPPPPPPDSYSSCMYSIEISWPGPAVMPLHTCRWWKDFIWGKRSGRRFF